MNRHNQVRRTVLFPLRRGREFAKRSSAAFLKTGVWARFVSWYVQHAVSRPRLAALYYVFDRSFYREFTSVMTGKVSHVGSAAAADAALRQEAAQFALRRCVHRIEKGLIMRPRRATFAEDYISETVDIFSGLVQAGNGTGAAASPDSLVSWADDVLCDYFAAVEPTPVVEAARSTYQRASSTIAMLRGNDDRPRRVPYRRDLTPLQVTYDAMRELAHRRRSVRWFQARQVPRDLIDRAMEVALQAPSACNRQPFVFHFFDEPAMVQAVCKIPMGTKGYAHNVPAVAVIVGRQRAYPLERDRHLIYIDGALAAMSFMFALETLGLSSCPVNWPDLERREGQMRDLLGLAPDERPVMLIVLGYPEPGGEVAFSQKKELHEARMFNQLASTAS